MTMNVIPGSIQVLSKSPKKSKRLKGGAAVSVAPNNMCRWIGATRPDLRAHVPTTAGRFSRYNVF